MLLLFSASNFDSACLYRSGSPVCHLNSGGSELKTRIHFLESMRDKSASVLYLLFALAAIHQYDQVSEIPVRVLMFQPASWVARSSPMIDSPTFMPRGALGISLVFQPILYTPLWVDFCKRSIGSNELFAQGIPFPAWEVPHCSRWQIGLSGTGKQPQRVRFELSSVCVLELRSCLFFGRTWRGMQPAFLQQWHPTAPCFSLSLQLLGSCRHPRSGSLGCCPTMCWLSCPVGRVQRFSWVLQTHAVVWFDDVLIDALKSSFALFPRLRSKRSFAAFPPSSNHCCLAECSCDFLRCSSVLTFLWEGIRCRYKLRYYLSDW